MPNNKRAVAQIEGYLRRNGERNTVQIKRYLNKRLRFGISTTEVSNLMRKKQFYKVPGPLPCGAHLFYEKTPFGQKRMRVCVWGIHTEHEEGVNHHLEG